MKYLTFALILTLVGCAKHITQAALESAESACAPNNGVRSITVHNVSSVVFCHNGSRFIMDSKDGKIQSVTYPIQNMENENERTRN